MYSVVVLAAAFALPARAGQVASLETETFVGDERSWKILSLGYAQILPARLKEIEGSMPGRFFANADVSVLDHMENGHFLKVSCGAGEAKAPCPDKRNLLEARVVAATFLEAAPKTHRMDELIRPKTLELTALGRRTLAKVEEKCPDFWQRLRKMTEDVVGTKKGALSATGDP